MPCKRKIKAAPPVLRCDPGKETNLAKLQLYLESFAKGKLSNEAKGKGKSKPEKRTRKQNDVARFPDGVSVRFDEEDYEREGNMHIFVRTKLRPVPFTLDVHVSDTLDDVKGKIRARGVPIDGQRLMVEFARLLDGDRTLKDMGIPYRAMLFLVGDQDLMQATICKD